MKNNPRSAKSNSARLSFATFAAHANARARSRAAMRRSACAVATTVGLASLFLAPSARAATITWDDEGGDGLWEVPANWYDVTNSTNDVMPLATDDLVFGSVGPRVIDLDGDWGANSLRFSANGFTLGLAGTLDDVLTLGTNSITVDPSVTGTINAVLAGTSGLTKTGTGTLALTNTGNTFTGGTTISAGKLSASVSSTGNALGTGTVNLAGGTLELTPTASQVAGISGRVFSTGVALTDSSRVDYTQTAGSLRTDLDINIAANVVPANTAVQWLGKIKITAGGSYTFGSASDDGSRLWIDGVLVVNNDGSKPVTDNQGTVTLSPGLHDIRIDFTQGGGGSGEILRYSGPDQLTYGVIPGAVLYQAETSTLAGASNAVVAGTSA